MKRSLALSAVLCAVLVLPSLSRAQVYNSGGPLVNNAGQPIAGNVAVCSTKPPGTNPPDCGTFVQTYTDSTLSVTCSLNPVTVGPLSGAGCTNPGKTDSRGNATYYTNSTTTWNEYYGYGFNTYLANVATLGQANFASPPAIGNVTPNTGNFSVLTSPVVSLTPPATWVGVTAGTRSDAERHAMGSTFPLSIEAPNSFVQGGVYVMDVPSNATSSPTGNNDNTLATYGRSSSSGVGTVGLFAEGLSGATGVQEWSANFSVANCDGTTVGCSNGHAFGGGNMDGLEQDVNVFTSATSTVPANVDGIVVVGGSTAQPSTLFNALHIRPAGINGCPGSPSSCIPFKVGINFDDGASTTGIQLGTNQTGNSQQSTPIIMTGRDSGGTARNVTLLSDQFGDFTVQTTGSGSGLVVSAAGDVSAGVGIAADAGGMKHKRITTGSLGTGRSDVALSWTTPFADANYTVTCSVVDTSASGAGLIFERLRAVSASGLTAQINNASGGNLTGTLECMAMHD